MTEARSRRSPGPDHPITVARAPSRVVVRDGETVVAESDRALELQEASYPPVFYVPLDDVDPQHLRPSDHHTYCPYKGEASYYDLVGTDGGERPAAAWYYDDPYPEVARIRGHVAFYADRVQVAVTPKD